MTGLGSSCGACKFLRRKCTSACVFAPYFCYDEAAMHFAAVHKVFGASNVSKLLMHLPVQNRGSAAMTISYEALARMSDPVYGCVAQIFALQQQISSLQEEIDILGSQIAGHPTIYSRESSNATNDCLITQQDALNGKDYWHQESEPFVNATDTTLEQVINSQLNSELVPPPRGWQDESILHGFGMRNSERVAEEMEQEMLLQYYNSVGELLNGPI